jgi:hypothetical protein
MQGICFDGGRMRHQEPQPAPRTVQARDAEARTPTHPRPHEGESKHYSLPMTEPDVKFAAMPIRLLYHQIKMFFTRPKGKTFLFLEDYAWHIVFGNSYSNSSVAYYTQFLTQAMNHYIISYIIHI